MRVQKTSEVKPTDIFYVPKGDVLCLTIDPPFNNKCTLIQDIGEDDSDNLKKFVKALTAHAVIGVVGKDHQMYAGDDYGQE